MEHGECPHCSATLSIPCISIVDNLRKLRSLLDGTLNTVTCHGCGEPVPAWIRMNPDGWDIMAGPAV